jgi:enamine deaminase RidA (YjgF/YER057c/UK114 family)
MITPDLNRKAAAAMPDTLRTIRRLHRQHDAGLDIVTCGQTRVRELHITIRPRAGEKVAALFQRLSVLLKEQQASIVKQDIFGSLAVRNDALDAMKHAVGEIQWPVTWVEGASCGGAPVAGLQVFAVSGAPVHTLTVGKEIVGRVFDDGVAKQCYLGGLGPKDVALSQADQTRQLYENLEAALLQAGMNVTNVVRTWFFLDDILSWYDQFNGVRNEFFTKHRLFPGSLPASTGVSGRNPAKSALVANVWAMQPRDASVQTQAVPSPLQCPAPEYGSAFSRALEISSPHGRRVLVSGTASIAVDGHTARLGDVRAQIALTMEVVKAILDGRNMTFSDVTRAIAYFKHKADAPPFAEWCAAHGVAFLPAVLVQSDICRPELLFEIELDTLV